MNKINFIDEVDIRDKTVLLRVDFNVSLNPDHTIANDERVKRALPTIKYLLERNNRLILLSHLGRPKGVDQKGVDQSLSLRPVVGRLKDFLPDVKIALYPTIEELEKGKETIRFLENIRFFPEEKDYSTNFAKKLAALADVYVNDAFGVCHRADTSVVGPPKFLPAFGGLLLKKEVIMIGKVIENPQSPVTAIIGGAKISTKIGLLEKLSTIVDFLIIGGGLANTFLCAQGISIGDSFCEYEATEAAHKFLAKKRGEKPEIVLPEDALIADDKNSSNPKTVLINQIPQGMAIFDLGPKTLAKIGQIIAQSKTIIWNGPVGYFENPLFRNGTDFIYYSIAQNNQVVSVVGGGDTLAAISKKEYLDKITHVSTGGGAMLEFIEKGTLPGIEALKR